MTFHRTALFAAVAALAVLGSAAHAQATIDHNKALAGNVTPGDGAGYPITISVPGSYKLMSNLVVPAGTSGIVITADNVTIDLNGFSVQGPSVCNRNAATYYVECPETGSKGITSAANTMATVRNGMVRGFHYGVRLEGGGRAADLTLMHNHSGLATAGNGSLSAARVHARLNRFAFLSTHGFVTEAYAEWNHVAFHGVSVSNSVAQGNVLGSTQSAIHGSRIYDNKTNVSSSSSY